MLPEHFGGRSGPKARKSKYTCTWAHGLVIIFDCRYHINTRLFLCSQAIKKDPEAYVRVMRSYKLMLDFFGMRVKDEKTGELERGDNWQERFTNLRM